MSFSKYCFAHDPASSDGIVLCAYLLSRVQLFVTPWAAGAQAPLSMGFPLGKNTEWFAMPFPRGSSQPRDRTQVSDIEVGFFTISATREAQEYWSG